MYDFPMRTNIEIDDKLMAQAQRAARTATKKETVEVALRQLVDRHRRARILKLGGKADWDLDLDESRGGRD